MAACGIAADQRGDPAVVTAPGRLVPADHPACAGQRAAGHRGREHRLRQDVQRVSPGAARDEVLGVREPCHLLEPRPQDPGTAAVADAGHHLQFLVEHHVQLVGFLVTVQERHQSGEGGAVLGIAVRATDRVHHRVTVVQAYVAFRCGADEGSCAGVDEEGPVRAGLLLAQSAEDGACHVEVVVGDTPGEASAEHEVRAGALPDLVADDPFDGTGIGVVVGVEVPVDEPDRDLRDASEQIVQRHHRLLGDQHRDQRRAVVDTGEATLAELPVGDDSQDLMSLAVFGAVFGHRDIGELVRHAQLAGQYVELVSAGPLRAVQQCERGRLRCQHPAEQT